jgi:hypothetical protein
MSLQLPAFPQGLTGASLITALNDRLRRISDALGSTPTQAVAAPVAIYGTHTARIGRRTPADGTLYIETDRSGVVYQARGAQWAYISGMMQADWASLPTDLGLADTGFAYFDSVNSLHIWQWNGTAWEWGPGDRHSGEFGQFDADPGTGWHVCDGSINQTKYAADGTRVTTFTVPDQREFYLKASATYTGVGVVAAAPGLTGLTASGTAVITPLNTASGSANITVSAIPVDTGSGQVAQSGTGVTVAAHPHIHAAPAAVDAGHVHSVAPVDGGHTHGVGTLAVDGTATPPTFAVNPYYRL